MYQHDRKQRQTFQHAPQQRRMISRLIDKIGDGKKPGPVQINGDSEKLEQTDGALARWHF
jgi:hypothetical protein